MIRQELKCICRPLFVFVALSTAVALAIPPEHGSSGLSGIVNESGGVVVPAGSRASNAGPSVAGASSKLLYSISRDDELLRTVNPLTAQSIATVPITLPGRGVLGGNGLAINPADGKLWALVKLVEPCEGDATRTNFADFFGVCRNFAFD